MDRCGGFQKIPRLGRLSHDHNEPRATVEGAATSTGVGKSVFTCGSRKKGRRKAVMGSRVDLWRCLTYGTLAYAWSLSLQLEPLYRSVFLTIFENGFHGKGLRLQCKRAPANEIHWIQAEKKEEKNGAFVLKHIDYESEISFEY